MDGDINMQQFYIRYDYAYTTKRGYLVFQWSLFIPGSPYPAYYLRRYTSGTSRLQLFNVITHENFPVHTAAYRTPRRSSSPLLKGTIPIDTDTMGKVYISYLRRNKK